MITSERDKKGSPEGFLQDLIHRKPWESMGRAGLRRRACSERYSSLQCGLKNEERVRLGTILIQLARVDRQKRTFGTYGGAARGGPMYDESMGATISFATPSRLRCEISAWSVIPTRTWTRERFRESIL